MNSFSERHNLDLPDAEIVIRHEAPDWLRGLVVDFAYDVGFQPSDLRTILCKKLLESPDLSNWSERPNIDREVRGLIDQAPWFFVYDFIEQLYAERLACPAYTTVGLKTAEDFQNRINRAFRKKGVGWQLAAGVVQVRGPEVFEQTLHTATVVAAQTGREVARNELHEALKDMSRRPNPELTGAIQHAMAALECVARDVTGDPRVTLGEWVKKNPGTFPPPLGNAVEKLWGYASEYGRHLKEGRPPTFEETEMVVGVAGALTTYLLRKP